MKNSVNTKPVAGVVVLLGISQLKCFNIRTVGRYLVYQIIKAVYEHEKEKNAIHPLAKMYTVENAFRGSPGVPVGFHPGAIKYYK